MIVKENTIQVVKSNSKSRRWGQGFCDDNDAYNRDEK